MNLNSKPTHTTTIRDKFPKYFTRTCNIKWGPMKIDVQTGRGNLQFVANAQHDSRKPIADKSQIIPRDWLHRY